jgi:N6-adenosine-specific RNA methylase IME4
MSLVEINPWDVRIPSRRRPLDRAVVEQLKESIGQIGITTPITVGPDLTLIAGLHRVTACRELKIKIPAQVITPTTELHAELAEIDENLIRGELSALERGEHLARRKQIYEQLNPRARHGGAPGKAGGGKARDPDSGSLVSFVDDTAAKTGRARSTIAEEVRIAQQLDPAVKERLRGTEIADNKTVLAALAAAPVEEQREIIARGEKEILAAAREIKAAKAEVKREQKIERIAKIAEAPAPALALGKRFPVILADPPWKYEDDETRGAAEDHYPTMDVEQICSLPVLEHATDDAILFLWATSPLLQDALAVMNAWDFDYRSSIVWVKPRTGMGHWVRVNHEFLLVGVRGKMPAPPPKARPSSIITAPVGPHSAKPEESYRRIEEMYPRLPRLELFARRPRKGWTVWGNQAGGGS